jgi:nicotinamide mononucleotide transporter
MVTALNPPRKLPLWGTTSNLIETGVILVASFFLTLLYSSIADRLETPTSKLEFWSLVFSFACVWLSRTENVLSMATGIVSVVLMGVFLLRVDLVGQGWLQFVFYVPIQFFGWWSWCRGGEGRTELKVGRLISTGWMLSIAVFSLAWVFFIFLFNALYESPQYLIWDTSIVSASVIAQILMTRKKVECWFFWTFPVNVSAMLLYWIIDVPAFSFLYFIFLANAFFGWRQWNVSKEG